MKLFQISTLALLIFGQTLLGANPSQWVQALHGEDYAQRRSALNALESYVARASDQAADAGKRANLERELLGYVGDPQLPELTRAYVMRLLPGIAGEATQQQMVSLLLDPHVSGWLGNEAAGVLAILADPLVAERLLKALPTAPAPSRELLISALAQRADPQAAEGLIKLLNQNKLALDDRLAQTLGAMGGTDSANYLFKQWKQAKGTGQTALARALLHSGAGSASMLQELATRSEDPEVRVGSLLQWASANEADALKFLQTQVEQKDARLNELVAAQLDGGGSATWSWMTNHHTKLPDATMIIVLQRVMEQQRRELEPWVLQLLGGASAPVELAAIRCLGVIGGSASIDALEARIQSRSEKLASVAFQALASLQDPSLDERLLALVKQPQDANYLKSLDLLSVRNSSGTVDIFNAKFSKESPRGEELTVVMRALERVGNVESVKRMLTQLLVETDATVLRNLQIAIKRLVIRLEQPDRLWKEGFEPALALAADSNIKARILPLMDGFSSSETLKVSIAYAEGRDTVLARAAEQALIRWRRIEVCDYWMNVFNQRGATEAQQQHAVRMIGTTLRSDYLMDSGLDVVTKVVELFASTENEAMREALLSVVRDMDNGLRGNFSRQMHLYLSMDRYRDQIKALTPNLRVRE